MKTLVITQARTGSTRLPNKILLEINGKSLLEIHINRIKRSKKVNAILIATTNQKNDQVIEDMANCYNVLLYQGSETDVLDRFYQAAKLHCPKFVVRLTSDCPLIDPILLDEVISEAEKKDLDYYTNILEEKYPDGQDIEVFKFSALEKAWKEATLKSDREHVTPYIKDNSTYKGFSKFTSDNHDLEKNYNHVRLTVDEQKDFDVISLLINSLGVEKNWKTYADYYLNNKNVRSLNQQITRNEGYEKSLKEN